MNKTGKTVFSVTAIAIAGRLLSLISIQMYMSVFGASDPIFNAFAYAKNVPDLIFNSFGTSITSVVVPLYSGYAGTGDDKSAFAFLNRFLSVSLVLIAALTLLCELFAPAILTMTDYKPGSPEYGFALHCLRIMIPLIIFQLFSYSFIAALQSHGKFMLPAAVTLPTSLTVIGYILLFGKRFGVEGLLYASFAGLALQAIVLVPSILKTGWRFKFDFNLRDKDLRAAGRRILPVLAAASAYQINMFVNQTLATRFNTVALMDYVQKLILVSMTLLINPIASVFYPKMSVDWVKGDKQGYKNSVYSILGTIVFLMLPLSFGFVLMRTELFSLLSGLGQFGQDDVTAAAGLFGMYAVGLLFICMKEVLDKASYAQKDTVFPAVAGFVIMAVNIALSFALIGTLGSNAMPLSYSIASFCGTALLIVLLVKRVGMAGRGEVSDAVKSLAAALIMTAAVIALKSVFAPGEGFASRLVDFAVPTLGGIIVYFGSSLVMRNSKIRRLIRR